MSDRIPRHDLLQGTRCFHFVISSLVRQNVSKVPVLGDDYIIEIPSQPKKQSCTR